MCSALALACSERRGERTQGEAAARDGVTSPAPVSPDGRDLCKDRDRVAFIFAADTHFGASPEVEARNHEAIRQMNAMPGTPWPKDLGGVVPELCGVLVGGDLTENGKPEEWQRFVAAFGLRGGDGALTAPVFETFGNHDKHSGFGIIDHVRERHGGAPRFGGLSYSFDWGRVHVASLGEAPDDDDLAWLRRDLDAMPKGSGVVIFLHFPMLGGFSRGQWFGDGDYRDKLAAVLEGRDVLGIFHGHYHATGLYTWKGFDVYRAGSPKHSFHAFDVVEIADQKMKVASWDYDAKAFTWHHEKAVFGGTSSPKKKLDPRAPP